MSFATFCVCLELRSLPSTRVTRFPRYYEPLRHPRAPGLSLAGVRLVLSSLTTLMGFPCCVRFPCVRAAATTPVQRLGVVAHLTQPQQPSPITLPGRPAHRPFRGLLSVHSRCGRTLAPSPICDQLHRRLQPFCYLHDCSGCFRLERLPGGACTHWKAPPCHGAHVKRTLRLAGCTSSGG
jgi:hypothetical protein